MAAQCGCGAMPRGDASRDCRATQVRRVAWQWREWGAVLRSWQLRPGAARGFSKRLPPPNLGARLLSWPCTFLCQCLLPLTWPSPPCAGRVTCCAFDDQLIVSGCSQAGLRLWSMDDLKCTRVLRHHVGSVTSCALLAGMPISAGEDGTVALWDASGAPAPIVTLDAGHPVAALSVGAHNCEWRGLVGAMPAQLLCSHGMVMRVDLRGGGVQQHVCPSKYACAGCLHMRMFF